jgi:hypothetical protein
MRRMRCARCEIDEERLVGHQRLLLTHPADGTIRQVLCQVITLFRRSGGLHRRRAVIQRRIPLVVLPADEPVKRLEPPASGRPGVKRAQPRGLPHWHLVALAELGRGVSVELQRHRQRRLRVRAQRAVARSRCGGFGNAAHPHRVVVAARQQGLACRCAECGGVEPVVPQAPSGEPVSRRRTTCAAECAGSTEADVIEKDDQHVWRTLWWNQGLDRRVRRVRILAS